MQSFGKRLQAADQKQQAQLRKEQQQLKKNASIETKASQKQAETKFQHDVQAYQKASRQREKEFAQKRASLLQPLQASLENVISKYAKEHGYDLVLDGSAAIYNANDMDLTSRILKAFNKAQPHAPAPDTSVGAQALRGGGH